MYKLQGVMDIDAQTVRRIRFLRIVIFSLITLGQRAPIFSTNDDVIVFANLCRMSVVSLSWK